MASGLDMYAKYSQGTGSDAMESCFPDVPAGLPRCPRDRHSFPIFISPDCPQHGLSCLMLVSSQRLKTRAGHLTDVNSCREIRLDDTSGFVVNMAFAFGLCKLFCGVATFLLGISAIIMKATLSNIGAGLWAGMSTLLSGVAALMTSRVPHSHAMLMTFLCWSITSLTTSGLLFAFSVTGLTKDLSSRLPTKVHLVQCVFDNCFFERNSSNIEDKSHASVTEEMSEGVHDVDEVSSRLWNVLFKVGGPEAISSAALSAVAAIDCLVSIASITLVCTATCRCCFFGDVDDRRFNVSRYISEQMIRRDRLLGWLQQQQRLRPSDLGQPSLYSSNRDCIRMEGTE